MIELILFVHRDMRISTLYSDDARAVVCAGIWSRQARLEAMLAPEPRARAPKTG